MSSCPELSEITCRVTDVTESSLAPSSSFKFLKPEAALFS